MSAEQRDTLAAILRQSAFPADSSTSPPGCLPHVFQAYYAILDEGAAALNRAGQFLSAQLAGAERVAVEHEAERKLFA